MEKDEEDDEDYDDENINNLTYWKFDDVNRKFIHVEIFINSWTKYE